MFTKFTSPPKKLDSIASEKLADVLFEIGKGFYVKAVYEAAVPWLERAYGILTKDSWRALSIDAEELQTCILCALVRSLIKISGKQSIDKAWNVLENQDITQSERMVFLLLKLDLIVVDSDRPPADYSDILLRLVRTVHMTESNFKTVLHHVHVLRSRSTTLAHYILETLLSERLNEAKRSEQMEKVFVTIVWNLTTSTKSANDVERLRRIFNTRQSQAAIPLSASATHAIQIVSFPMLLFFPNYASLEANLTRATALIQAC